MQFYLIGCYSEYENVQTIELHMVQLLSEVAPFVQYDFLILTTFNDYMLLLLALLALFELVFCPYPVGYCIYRFTQE